MESGADLSSLFVDILRKSETPITPEWVTKVTYLFKLMRAGMPERDAYLVSATKWAKVPHSKFSDPLFHEVIIRILFYFI